MNPVLHYSLLLLIPSLVLLHLYVSPYTKVEESFNIQAIHDILVYGVPIRDSKVRIARDYDHATFPGSVPRTFVGAWLLAEIARPWTRFISDPEHVQLLVRAVLGLLNSLALLSFHDAVVDAFGKVAGRWYILLQASQFHIIYYASRTLPNMFAFILSTLALRFILLSNFGPRNRRARRCRIAISLLTFTGIVFRSELAVLLASECGFLLLRRRLSLRWIVLPAGIGAMLLGLLTTLSVDSFFWQQFPLWPEWAAFRYNTIEGKSSEWGTSPAHFYFTSALPRLLLNPFCAIACIGVAFWEKTTRRFSFDILAPLIAFIGVLSILPHKEWRFIIYTIPGFTAVASAGAAWLWSRKTKTFLCGVLTAVLVLSVVASFAASTGLLVISSLNYPGAHALKRLHEIAHGERPLIRVHLDNLSRQTGITKFLEKPAPSSISDLDITTVWHYDKTEDPVRLRNATFWERFDYILAENKGQATGDWEVVESIYGFAGLRVTSGPSEPSLRPSMYEASDMVTQIYRQGLFVYETVEHWLRKHVTNGRWLRIQLEPRILIFKKKDS